MYIVKREGREEGRQTLAGNLEIIANLNARSSGELVKEANNSVAKASEM